MRGWVPYLLAGVAVLVVLFLGLVPAWRAPGPGYDVGPPGQSMVQFLPSETEARQHAPPPPKLPVVADDPRPATAAFRNVKVLTDVNAGDFMRLQNAMTAWVSPAQGCGFCHAGSDYASDANPRKAAARLMLTMTRHVNTDWKSHVGAPGVTCFSCHQGQPVPSEIWFQSPPRRLPPQMDKGDDWREEAHTVRGFFPTEGYEEYLLQATPAHGEALTALPTGSSPSFPEVKRLYEAMMQMSEGMGVNCGYCHHSRDFTDWSQSTPMRWTSESGIQMTRDLNRTYLLPLAHTLPLTRYDGGKPRTLSLPAREQGPQAGNGLAECATCHHGEPRPRDTGAPAAGVPGLTPAVSAGLSPPSAAPDPAPTRVAAAAAPAPVRR